jgi:hypothetical protein
MNPGTAGASLDVSAIFTGIHALAHERRSPACEGASLWCATQVRANEPSTLSRMLEYGYPPQLSFARRGNIQDSQSVFQSRGPFYLLACDLAIRRQKARDGIRYYEYRYNVTFV